MILRNLNSKLMVIKVNYYGVTPYLGTDRILIIGETKTAACYLKGKKE
jgi:hypothetical protein